MTLFAFINKKEQKVIQLNLQSHLKMDSSAAAAGRSITMAAGGSITTTGINKNNCTLRVFYS